MLEIELWPGGDPGLAARDVDALRHLLHACVAGGAGVSFVLPFSLEEAEFWWRAVVLPAVESGKRRLLVARWDGWIVGAVQLGLDTPPNQPHRADVMKLLVHPDARRKGIARALMVALEDQARLDGRTLLTLDTVTGDAAEQLYLSIGFVSSGVIPGYAWNPAKTKLDDATFFYKELP